jgi:hypothetical protein
MNQDLITAEIQALLASLKASLSGNPVAIDGTTPESASIEKQESDRLQQDRLPDVRTLRRFLLMV